MPDDAVGYDGVKVSTPLREKIASIDKQLPNLSLFGFALWMAWNTIAFSGSFWFHDSSNNVKLEDLILFFLTTCVITQLTYAALDKHISKLIAKRWFLFVNAAIASIGTFFIVITRETLFPSPYLFFFGSILAGLGTTALSVRSAPLFGSLPPRRALIMLATCCLCASALYFMLYCCPSDFACGIFIVLPLFSACLYALRSSARLEHCKALSTQTKPSRNFVALLAFIMLCSCCLELVHAFIVIDIPPVLSIQSRVYSQLIDVPVMIAVILFVLATPIQEGAKGSAKLYSVATFALVVLIVAMVAIPVSGIGEAAATSSVTTCYNLTVWAMCAYIIYQAESSAIKVYCFATSALSIGTIGGGTLASAYHAFNIIGESEMRLLLMVFGLVILGSLVFVLSEKRMNALLLPIEQPRLANDVLGKNFEKQPKTWVTTCEEIAHIYGLSKRETEVFVALAQGRTAQEIADKEVLSVYTVRAHIRSVYAKLDVHSKRELTAFIEQYQEG